MFGFFISGPGITGSQNLATLPNSNTIVSINTVNDGSNVSCGVNNVAYYIVGTDTNNILDGFTVPLIATTTVTPGATYHLKLAIGDNSDQALDSYVILAANSLKSSNNNTPNSVSSFNKANGLLMSPTLFDKQIQIENSLDQNWLLVIYDINGSLVTQTELVKGMNKMNTSAFRSGNYVVKAINKNSNKVLTQRISKL